MRELFAHLQGNDHVKRGLCRMYEKGTIPPSLLFAGPQHVGKNRFAKAFAQCILKTERDKHPDFYHYQVEGKIGMHSLSSMRQLNQEVLMAPFEAQKKVFIVSDAERMLPTSANALLKTFEEPAPHSIIILVSSAPRQLLPTILSRCQTIRFHALREASTGKAEHKRSLQQKILLDALADGLWTSYHNCILLVKEITQHINDHLKKEEERIRSHVFEGVSDQLTAIQKEALEKEVEGFLSLQKNREATILFDTVLSWYRDLQLLYVNGDSALLIHADYRDHLVHALQRGAMRPMEEILEAAEEARQSLERSIPLSSCLEYLFLRIYSKSRCM